MELVISFILFLCYLIFIFAYHNYQEHKHADDPLWNIGKTYGYIDPDKQHEFKDLENAYFRDMQSRLKQPDKKPTFEEWKAAKEKKEQ